MAEHPHLPCPCWVTDPKTGERWYCEQGNKGHWSTCCGGKSEATYLSQVQKAKDQMKND